MNNRRLIVDIGNSAIELAIFDKENLVKFVGYFVLPSDIKKLKIALENIKKENLNKGMIFSVVPKHNKLIFNLVKKILSFKIEVFDWENYVLKNKNPKIREAIGADLLADIKAAEKNNKTTLVADCGTITKLLLIDEKGKFLGLSLIPGIEVMARLFSNNTALLPEIEIKNKVSTFGTNTIESMNHGVLSATISYIRNAFEDINSKNKKLVITGGNSRFIKNEFKGATCDPEFTLKGMNILFSEVDK